MYWAVQASRCQN